MIDQALMILRPGASWILNGDTYEGLQWLDTAQKKPTIEEIEQEIDRLIAEWTITEYKRNRAQAYPEIKEQLDMLWHAIDSGSLDKNSDFYLTLKAIKNRYPKPQRP